MASEPPRRATIHEVARLAGVSHQTVSRYFRHNGGLKQATREKIDAAVKALDYHPNLLARSMRTRRTNRLAVVLPSASYFPLRLLDGAALTVHEMGYQLELVGVEGGIETRSERVREIADSGQVEGILSLAPLTFDATAHKRVPILVTGDYDDRMRGMGQLADGSPVKEIIEYLAGLGHRTFLHVAGPQGFASARNRRLVYEETIEAMRLTSYGVVEGGWSAQYGYHAITSLPADSGVTAVVAANDLLAMGVVRGALSRGWMVPQDLSVFGWDDEEMGRFATPALSTVAVDREKQGRDAMLRLIAAVQGKPMPEVAENTINQLIIRETTGAARRPAGRSG